MHRICTIGNLTIDDVILYDTHQMFLETSGGDALYGAIGARVWENTHVILMARAGKSYPASELARLDGYGIDASYLVRVDSNDIHDWALYEPGGGRQFINHLSSGTRYDLSITGQEIPIACMDADGYHLAAMPTDVQATVIERLCDLKGPIAWDPHVEYLEQPHFNKMAYKMLEGVDFFLPSKEEATALYGSNDMVAAARSFANAGASIVAIKMSTKGSLVYVKESDRFYRVPIYPANAVDPTGAGDSYCGGFVVGFLETGDPVHAACYGTVSSSYVVEYVGALNTFNADFSTAKERLEFVKNTVEII